MAEFTFGNYRLLVDVEKTRAWYAAHGEIAGGCSCAYCRNFAAAIQTVLPEIKAFFDDLGLDIRKPREAIAWGPGVGGLNPYEGLYHLAGAVRGESGSEIELAEGFQVNFDEDCDLLPENFPRPCFQCNVSMRLPWLLKEPKPGDL